MAKKPNAETLLKQQEAEEQKIDKQFLDEYTVIAKKYNRDIGAKLVYGEAGVKPVPRVVRLQKEEPKLVKA